MFAKNTLTIFIGMQRLNLFSAVTANPYENTQLKIKERPSHELNRTLARTSLRRKPLPD